MKSLVLLSILLGSVLLGIISLLIVFGTISVTIGILISLIIVILVCYGLMYLVSDYKEKEMLDKQRECADKNYVVERVEGTHWRGREK